MYACLLTYAWAGLFVGDKVFTTSPVACSSVIGGMVGEDEDAGLGGMRRGTDEVSRWRRYGVVARATLSAVMAESDCLLFQTIYITDFYWFSF